MSYVNNEDINLATTYVRGKHSRCCCGIESGASLCLKCRPTTQICCLKMTRSTLDHSIMLRRRFGMPDPVTNLPGDYSGSLWLAFDPCDTKGPTNLCGTLWSDLGDCYPNEDFSATWSVSEDCETVTIKLYRVVLAPTHHPYLIGTWTVSRDWHTGTITTDDDETGGTITLENCENGVTLWPESETEKIFIRASLIHNGSTVGCKFGYGNSVCGTTWTLGYCGADFWTVSWIHSLAYGKVTISVSAAGGSIPGAARVFSTELDDDPLEWYLNLPVTVATSASGYSWKFERVYNCSGCPNGSGGTGTPPGDICDPGCWPPCVMCPERKRMFLVVDNDPSCCLSGTYELTWTGSGYSLASPTGTSTASCGLISAFTVTCVDATHIHVSITYRVIYALESNAVTENYNLSVSCAGGHMESEAMLYRLTGDQDQLCGSGDSYGGTIRVVSD